MAKKQIIVYGAGGQGKVVVDAIEQAGEYDVLGFLDDKAAGEIYGYPILGTRDYLESGKVEHGIIAVGNPELRQQLLTYLEEKGIEIATVVHPTAYIARGVTLGAGSVVLPKAVVGTDASIGKGCIINTGATIDHDCVLKDGVHVAPGAHLAGGVQVGEQTHIGIGTCIKEGVHIGPKSMIGAGSVVVSDIEAASLAYGNPAKRISQYNPS